MNEDILLEIEFQARCKNEGPFCRFWRALSKIVMLWYGVCTVMNFIYKQTENCITSFLCFLVWITICIINTLLGRCRYSKATLRVCITHIELEITEKIYRFKLEEFNGFIYDEKRNIFIIDGPFTVDNKLCSSKLGLEIRPNDALRIQDALKELAEELNEE